MSFFNLFFRRYRSAGKYFFWAAAIWCLLPAFFEPGSRSLFLFLYPVLQIIALLLLGLDLSRTYRRLDRIVLLELAVLAALFPIGIHDVLRALEAFASPFALSPGAFGVFLAVHLAVFSRDLSDRIRGAEYLSRNLKSEMLQQTRELKIKNNALKRISALDGLTSLANRRYLDEYLVREWERTRLEYSALALVLIDIDYFKHYNEMYGFGEGDACLLRIAQAVQATIRRPSDLPARYGGDKFAVVYPGADAQSVSRLAEHLQKTIQNLAIPHRGSLISSVVTASFGVAAVVPAENHSVAELLQRAELALHRAHNEGRNCVCLFDSNP